MLVLPIRFRVISAVSVIIIIFMLFVMRRDSQQKKNYDKVSGTIAYIDQQFGKWPNRDFGKYRYIRLDEYPYTFELFIGKDVGDFKPKFEQVDKLALGDVITVYYYETNDMQNDGINRHAKFIDKESMTYFEAGNSINLLAFL